VEGRHEEAASSTGAIARAAAAAGHHTQAEGLSGARMVALTAMAAELCCADSCDAALLLQYLPCLLAADAAASLQVLQARGEVEPEHILPLLAGASASALFCFRAAAHPRCWFQL
jgi:hypothetical protein